MSENYALQLQKDYKKSLIETYDLCKSKPKKISAYIGLLATISHLSSQNPTFKDFKRDLQLHSLDLSDTPQQIRNPKSVRELEKAQKLLVKDQLKFTNLGIFSIVWYDGSHVQCKEFLNISSYFYPSGGCNGLTGLFKLFFWAEPRKDQAFLDRIYSVCKNHVLDIGFYSKWRNLENAMIDYDVNEEEFNK